MTSLDSSNHVYLEADMEGFLKKQRRSSKIEIWDKRWFIFKQGSLSYLKNNHDVFPKTFVDLNNVVTIQSIGSKEIRLMTKQGENLFLKCLRREDRDNWVTCMGGVIKKEMQKNKIEREKKKQENLKQLDENDQLRKKRIEQQKLFHPNHFSKPTPPKICHDDIQGKIEGPIPRVIKTPVVNFKSTPQKTVHQKTQWDSWDDDDFETNKECELKSPVSRTKNSELSIRKNTWDSWDDEDF